jgi:protein-disulfide isomerase
MFRKVSLAMLVCVALAGCSAQDSSTTTPTTKSDKVTSNQSADNYTKQGVLNYLAKNEKVLIEAVQAYQQQQVAAREESFKQSQNAIKDHFNDIFKRKGALSIGSLNSPISVVEFYDYNCGYCLKAHNELTKLMAQNKDVRVTYMPVGFLGQKSAELAKLVLAAHQISAEKFTKFSKAMWDQGWNMEKRQRVTVDWVMENAAKYGYNAKELRTASKSSAIEKIYRGNIELAKTIGVRGTPSFVIGNINTQQFKLIPGFVPADALQKEINALKS